jgi:hypothetical protein
LIPRSALADNNAAIDKYDVIFVGFPIWAYVAPPIINVFLESYDFSNKVVIPFATSGGSDLGRTIEKLKPSITSTTVLHEGKIINGTPSKEDLAVWVASLNI